MTPKGLLAWFYPGPNTDILDLFALVANNFVLRHQEAINSVLYHQRLNLKTLYLSSDVTKMAK